MSRYQPWEKSPGLARESEPRESQGSRRRKRSKKHADGVGTLPANCDSCDEISQMPLRNASEVVPGDSGSALRLRVSLPATNTWPSSERSSAKGNKKPT